MTWTLAASLFLMLIGAGMLTIPNDFIRGAALVPLGIGTIEFIFRYLDKLITHYHHIQNARSRSQQSYFVEKLAFLANQHPDLAKEIIEQPWAMEVGVEFYALNDQFHIEQSIYTLEGNKIPFYDEEIGWDAWEFFYRASMSNLRPIGDYSDSKARTLAAMLTDDMVARGLARQASGPFSARWKVPFTPAVRSKIRDVLAKVA